MKITFLEPPPIGKQVPERLAGCSYELYHFPDLANLYLCSILDAAGHTTVYQDCILLNWNWDQFTAFLKNDNSDCYIIHSVILSKKGDLSTLDLIRKTRGNQVMIIFHGPEPTRVPEEYLRDDLIVVCRGEPDRRIPEYIKNGSTDGVSLRNGGAIVHHKTDGTFVDLDSLPYPMREHPSLAPYKFHYSNPKFTARPFTVMMGSRGCAFKCLFCVPLSISFATEMEYLTTHDRKPPVRVAGASRVIAEFKDLARSGYRAVMFVDDQFLWAKERTLEICDGIRGSGIQWGCLSRADFLADENVVSALASAGCRSIDIGVESLRQETLDFVQKDLTVDTIHKAIYNLKKHGIRAKLNIMLGTCPTETFEQLKYTIEEVAKLPVNEVMFSIATPFKGTSFFTYCKEQGYLLDESDDIDPMSKCIVRYPAISGAELEKLQRFAYRHFYLRPRFILDRMSSWRSIGDFVRDLKLGGKILGF